MKTQTILALVITLLCSCTANQFYRETKADGSTVTVYNGGSVETKSDTTTHTTDITRLDGTHIVFNATTVKNDETSLSGQYFLFKGTEVVTKSAAHVQTNKDTFAGKAKLKGTKNPNVIPKDPNVIPADPNIVP